MIDPRTLSLATLIAGAFLAWNDVSLATDDDEDESAIEEPPPWERIDEPSVVACGGCHPAAWREWSQSLHANAWTNANVRNATNDFNKKSCRPCHSPQPVLLTGLDVAPDYRDHNQLDGVHCLSCHGLEEGVAAARSIPDAPCNPIHEPRLLSVEMCWPCHEPTHQAFEEYETSDAAATGVRCVDCHMQLTDEREGGRHGRSHGPNGGMNAEFVARALAWEAELQDGELRIRLRNRTGHKFPGEIPSRSLLVRVDWRDAEGQSVGEGERLVLRRAHKQEEREDNRLRPDEQRELRYAMPSAAQSVDLRIVFLPLPLLPEEAGFELARWSASRDED